MLNDLQKFNSEISSEKRREILSAVTDLFLYGADNHENMDVALFGDIMLRIMDRVESNARAELSNRVATCDQTPREVAKSLANDELEVAAPVLRSSPVLTDEDLIDVASRHSQGHLLAISERSEVNELVTNILVDRGDKEVIRTVSANHGAKFSRMGFSKLAGHAADDNVVGENLVNRKDITPEIADIVIPVLPPELAAKLQALVSQHLSTMSRSELADERMAARRNRVSAMLMADQIKSGELDLNDCIVDLTASDRFVDLTVLLAKLTDLQEKIVRNIFFGENAEPIVLICKSLDIDNRAFEKVAKLWRSRLKMTSNKTKEAITQYDSLSVDIARRALRFVLMKSNVG